MSATTGLTKRAMIDKANASIVLLVSVATFVSIFSLVATKTLFSQIQYQQRVISKTREAARQLESNVQNAEKLRTSYQAFAGATTNIIGGINVGDSPKDGDNAKIILDALPSNYDFPALATNLEMLATQQTKLTSITGTDDEVVQSANATSGTPQPVEMPFQLTAEGNYDQVKSLIVATEHSIRPIQHSIIEISGSQSNLTLNITANTYYQPAKTIDYKSEVVR